MEAESNKETVSSVRERHLHCDGSDEDSAKGIVGECTLKTGLMRFLDSLEKIKMNLGWGEESEKRAQGYLLNIFACVFEQMR